MIMMLRLHRQQWTRLASVRSIPTRTIIDNFISPRRHLLGVHLHTQTVHWEKDEAELETTCCQLYSFSPLSSDPLQALTVNDTTRGATALNHLRKGNSLVYTGGDFHNARQLLQTVKRKCVPRNMMKKKGRSRVDDTSEAWIEQKRLQREQSEIVNKILIQVSIGCSGGPSQIVGLKRTPKNVEHILSYAFQNDKEKIKVNSGDGGLSSSFLLSLSDFLGMVGGYEWHRKGVYIDALRDYIFPHYGVFPPTRQDYIKLLDNINADKRTQQNQTSMMEVGVGSGVLSLILLQQKKVDLVVGTDINPYAIACAKENIQRFGFHDQVNLIQADLFPPKGSTTIDGETNRKFDVVLFNPPWIPGDAATWLDQAVYDSDQNLLRRFLLHAQHHVTEDGHVYVLLSNLGMLLGLFKVEDLYDMFEEGNLELVEAYKTKSKRRKPTQKAEKESDGIANARAQEVISLYKLRIKK